VSDPRIIQGTNIETDDLRLLEKNYFKMGWSSFNGGVVDTDKAKKQAKDLGADVVVVYAQYSHTESGSIPWTEQVPNSSSTSGTITTPNGGMGSYEGTTHGTSTVVTQIPYSNAIFNYGAKYWAKGPPPIFGAVVIDIPTERTQELGRSSGVLVQAVQLDSPARGANLLRGDILTAFNGTPITSKTSYLEMLPQHRGEAVTITFIRNHEEQSVKVRLLSRPH